MAQMRPLISTDILKSGGRFHSTHLSKRLSDLKHNDTQEKAPFSVAVFNTLSPGVISFVVSVSSKNHLLTG